METTSTFFMVMEEEPLSGVRFKRHDLPDGKGTAIHIFTHVDGANLEMQWLQAEHPDRKYFVVESQFETAKRIKHGTTA